MKAKTLHQLRELTELKKTIAEKRYAKIVQEQREKGREVDDLRQQAVDTTLPVNTECAGADLQNYQAYIDQLHQLAKQKDLAAQYLSPMVEQSRNNLETEVKSFTAIDSLLETEARRLKKQAAFREEDALEAVRMIPHKRTS